MGICWRGDVPQEKQGKAGEEIEKEQESEKRSGIIEMSQFEVGSSAAPPVPVVALGGHAPINVLPAGQTMDDSPACTLSHPLSMPHSRVTSRRYGLRNLPSSAPNVDPVAWEVRALSCLYARMSPVQQKAVKAAEGVLLRRGTGDNATVIY